MLRRRSVRQPRPAATQWDDPRSEGGSADASVGRRSRAGWGWLAGGDATVLRTVPSEVSFYNGLGMWVAGMAVVSGFAMTVAASQWWSTSIASVLWVLPIWAVLYCLIERLVLKSFGTKWGWNLVLTIPRFLLSLAIAIVVGLPMAQVIYSGSINEQLSRTETARIHETTREITGVYEGKIAAARKEIAAAERKEKALQQQVIHSRFLAGCEIGAVECSETKKLGCGPYCKRDLRRAAAAEAALERNRPELEATIAAAQRKIAVRRATESAEIASRVAAIEPTVTSSPGRPRWSRWSARSGGEEVRGVLPPGPDRDRPRRAVLKPRIFSPRRRLRAERGGDCAPWTWSGPIAWRPTSVLMRRITLRGTRSRRPTSGCTWRRPGRRGRARSGGATRSPAPAVHAGRRSRHRLTPWTLPPPRRPRRRAGDDDCRRAEVGGLDRPRHSRGPQGERSEWCRPHVEHLSTDLRRAIAWYRPSPKAQTVSRKG